MNLLRPCLDRRVLAALAAAAILMVIVAPQLITVAIPLLVIAACPLSMVVMMATMRHGEPGASRREFRDANEVRRELADITRRRQALESELAALDPAPQRAGGPASR